MTRAAFDDQCSSLVDTSCLTDAVRALAEWSAWVPWAEVPGRAPRRPGVYLARQGAAGPMVYVGMAGERTGGAGAGSPKGLWGRLSVYATGKGAVSGLGEAALDRALRDPPWVRAQLARLEAGQVMRAKEWAQAAIERADLHVAWATTPDKAAARALERATLAALTDCELWNRSR